MPTIDENKRHWDDEYDWSYKGEEWSSADPRWKQAILEHAMEPHLRPGAAVLEIGPGAGRWTEELLRRGPARLIGVDLAERCVALCRERFRAEPRAEFHQNDGCDLGFLPDGAIDFVWSFDVFVHIDHDDVLAYFAEFARVMRSGAVGVVHYASIDRSRRPDPRAGWRSEFTSVQMHAILRRTGMELLADHYEPWISEENSSVAIFRRP